MSMSDLFTNITVQKSAAAQSLLIPVRNTECRFQLNNGERARALVVQKISLRKNVANTSLLGEQQLNVNLR